MYSIYVIQNKINKKIYVGQTKNFKARKARHKYEAFTKLNKKPLYQSIRKYGFNSFEFTEIDFASPKDIDELEMFWIQFFESNKEQNGYNLSDGGKPLKDPKIIKNKKPPMLGKKHSQETKDQMSENQAGNKNSFYGKTHSQEAKQKMGENLNRKYIGDNNYFYNKHFNGSFHGMAKLTEEIVLTARKQYADGMTYTELSKLYNINESTISRAVRRITWKHI